MNPNGMAQYFDVTTFLVFVFFIFFLGLVYYLRTEDKREGYPMISDVTGERERGFPMPPNPKTYLLQDGTTSTLPNDHERDPYRVARRTAAFPGAPLEPTGVNPLADGIGPASYVEMREEPFKAFDGTNTMVPLRAAPGWCILGDDPDPRGWPVTAADGVTVGEVADIWVDRGVRCLRYLEVALDDGGRILAPLAFLTVSEGRGTVSTRAITGAQFLSVPRLASPDQVTAREEDRIGAYFAGGALYAVPGRAEPLL